MVFDAEDEEEIPEWEVADEKAPSRLEKKWDQSASAPAKKVLCQSCGHEVSDDALLCLYCGQSTGVRAGFLSFIRLWIAKSYIWVLVFLALIVLFLYWSRGG